MDTDASSPSSPTSKPASPPSAGAPSADAPNAGAPSADAAPAGAANPDAVLDAREATRLLAEQAALRRVATLVARGVPASELFAAVTMEVGRLLEVDAALLVQLESESVAMLAGGWTADARDLRVGERLPLGGDNLVTRVAATRASARTDDYSNVSGALGIEGRDRGTRSGVAAPVIVEGRLWGTMLASTSSPAPLAPDTEGRLADFTDLLATAIANADSRAELAASRARILAATDEARRRIERDLHDGAQQRLVALTLMLRSAEGDPDLTPAQLRALLARLADEISAVHTELSEIARGIHPALLRDGGLGPALRTLARRSPVPVQVEIAAAPRLPDQIEVAAYYVVSEALTNAAKHGNPTVVRIEVELADGRLRITVSDDGPGGADPDRGSGLIGLRDRVEAVAGTLAISSRPGEGTTLTVELPAEP